MLESVLVRISSGFSGGGHGGRSPLDGSISLLVVVTDPPPASSREPSESAADCLEPSARVTSAASSACAARAVQSMLRPDESTRLEFGMAQTTSDAHLNTPGQLNATFKKTLCRGCFCTPGPALPGKSRCRHREGLPRDNASAQVVWGCFEQDAKRTGTATTIPGLPVPVYSG